MTVYEALYNDCIHESSFVTISIHKTKEGAEKAIAFHKMEKIKEHQEIYKEDEDGIPEFNEGNMQQWSIIENELKTILKKYLNPNFVSHGMDRQTNKSPTKSR